MSLRSYRPLAGLAAFAILPALLLAGCSGGGETAESQETPRDAATSETGGTFVGRVAETMDAGGYTYVHLEREDASIWAAGPEGEVQVGEQLGVSLGMKMENFHSETLDRTFDAVYFVNAFERGGAPSKDANGSDAMGAAHSAAPTSELAVGDVQKPAGGHSVAEIWAAKSELAGESVTLRGRVVKYNGGIMGRNWLHVQDGSGDPSSGDHDITVTTNDEASVGDVVLVTGVVAVDKDFGGGYRYGMIVEDASVERE